jgi:hypothetical protein
MAITATAYGQFLASLGEGDIDFTSDGIWVALWTGTYYTPDFDNDSDYFTFRHDSELPEEATTGTLDSDTVYSWNGQQLKSVSWSYDPVKKAAMLTADSVTWSALTGVVRYAIVYKWVTQSVDNIMIGCIDYGTDQIKNSESFTVDFSNGVVALAQ